MEIKKIIENNVATLKLTGWLDTQSAPQLGEAVGELDGINNLILDFDALEYISSSGLREILSASRKLSAAGGSFSVINVSNEVMDVFLMTGFSKKLNISGKENP